MLTTEVTNHLAVGKSANKLSPLTFHLQGGSK